MDYNDENSMGESPTILIGSGKYKTELTVKFKNRKNWEIPNPKIIKSVIPGTIIDVFVKKGDRVKRGDVLLILEAMKMQNRIEAPMSGVIKKINVKPDVKIPKNNVMIEIE